MIVDSCLDCPFCGPWAGGGLKCKIAERQVQAWEVGPDWCPLMKGPIVVQHRHGEPVCRIARCHHCLPADTRMPSMDMCTLRPDIGEKRVDEPEMYDKPAPDWCPRREK